MYLKLFMILAVSGMSLLLLMGVAVMVGREGRSAGVAQPYSGEGQKAGESDIRPLDVSEERIFY
jgi:hypothetical protein